MVVLPISLISTGIIRFITKQIATDCFSTVFFINRGVLYDILKV